MSKVKKYRIELSIPPVDTDAPDPVKEDQFQNLTTKLAFQRWTRQYDPDAQCTSAIRHGLVLHLKTSNPRLQEQIERKTGLPENVTLAMLLQPE